MQVTPAAPATGRPRPDTAETHRGEGYGSEQGVLRAPHQPLVVVVAAACALQRAANGAALVPGGEDQGARRSGA